MSDGVFGVQNCSKVAEPACGYEVQISLYVEERGRGRGTTVRGEREKTAGGRGRGIGE